MFKPNDFKIQVATEIHLDYADEICQQIEESATKRGTGIAKRSPEYIRKKILEGKAVIALYQKQYFAGFCYIETWSHGRYAVNSGLIVSPKYRKCGLAHRIKEQAFRLSRKKYPHSKIFGLTTSLAVMKINSDLGYLPVPFSELTDDQAFWDGCSSCINHHILVSKGHQNCLCTGMLYDPKSKRRKKWQFLKKSRFYERLIEIKKAVMMKMEKV